MNNSEAHFYLEELQRMMTQHRGIFSDDYVCANGMAIIALEQETKSGQWEEPEINPCRGCDDYDGQGGCLSNGGCAPNRED